MKICALVIPVLLGGSCLVGCVSQGLEPPPVLRAGDPCTLVDGCGRNLTCDGMVCVVQTGVECSASSPTCPPGDTCDTTVGYCVEGGSACRDGDCLDGETCVNGVCVLEGGGGAGGSGSGGGRAGVRSAAGHAG
jgi:hypothetical protein